MDGEKTEETLFDIVKDTWLKNKNNSVGGGSRRVARWVRHQTAANCGGGAARRGTPACACICLQEPRMRRFVHALLCALVSSVRVLLCSAMRR